MARGAKRSSKASRSGARQSRTPAVFQDLPADWYWEQDAELRFTRVDTRNGAPGEQVLAERILGKLRWETGVEIEGGWDEHRALLAARQPFHDVLMWRTFEDGNDLPESRTTAILMPSTVCQADVASSSAAMFQKPVTTRTAKAGQAMRLN